MSPCGNGLFRSDSAAAGPAEWRRASRCITPRASRDELLPTTRPSAARRGARAEDRQIGHLGPPYRAHGDHGAVVLGLRRMSPSDHP